MIKLHGAPERFEVVADFVYSRFGKSIKYIADVAGGQGMLTRILNKKYNYSAEVVDPRSWTLKGVPNRQAKFNSKLADYYDLIIGLHPDAATRSVVESALVKPVLIVPCCNFWDKTRKLGREAMLAEFIKYFDEYNVKWERVEFDFSSSKNVGLITYK